MCTLPTALGVKRVVLGMLCADLSCGLDGSSVVQACYACAYEVICPTPPFRRTVPIQRPVATVLIREVGRRLARLSMFTSSQPADPRGPMPYRRGVDSA